MKINQTIKWRIFSGCLAIAFQLLLQTATMAQPLGWNYKQGFSVTENSGANVYNYQLRLIIDTQTPIAAGQMNITGDDIRFGKYCSQPTFYDYWIESGMNTANTVVWVKIDTLPASSSLVVNMFYGNSIAAATSSINIFNGPIPLPTVLLPVAQAESLIPNEAFILHLMKIYL